MPDESFTILHTRFGFEAFRPGQQEAIQSLLAGRHTLVVMPTGAGKSLIFQIAGLQMSGITLVISPLIALMKDQVDSLQRRDIPATYINSALSAQEQAERLSCLTHGDYRIVYIAPERLRSVSFLKALHNQMVSLLAVDEAHCISEWGHDFRPDYLHIAQARAVLGNPLTVALTATATPDIQSDIIRLLGLTDANRIITGFNRPNLNLRVCYTSGIPAKLRALSELLSAREAGAVILYTGTRRDAEEVAEFAHEVVKTHAEFYHAGLGPEERTRIQNDFISSKLKIIVATNAFGMGIDRADVRHVIHYSLPGSLEAYYQEAGRAGRDGQPARATLLYDPQDRALHEFFISKSTLSPAELLVIYNAFHNSMEIWITTDELSRLTGLHPVQIKVGLSELERARALEHLGDEGIRMLFRRGKWNQGEIDKAAVHSQEHIKHRQTQLDGIVRYAESNLCRRKIILKYFGDSGEATALDCCDNCRSATPGQASGKEAVEMSHGERVALIIFDCIRRVRIKVGREKLAQILLGSKAQDILKFHHDRNGYYGKLAIFKQNDIEEMIGQLVELGYIKIIGGEYPILSLTPRGENAIRQKETVALKLPRSLDVTEIGHAKAKLEAGGTVEYTAQLLAQGIKPEEIAHQRGLTLITIYGHCAKLIEAGKINIDRVIPKHIQYKIEEAIRKVGSTQYLFPIKTLLPEEITYEMIRCVVINLDLNHLKPIAETYGSPTSKPQSDKIDSFLTMPHPRPLIGPWQAGWALGFHSRILGGDWSRSDVGDLTHRLKYESDITVLPVLIQQTLDLFHAHPEMNLADVIIPVPSSTERKVNPVYVFCKALACKINLPMQSLVAKTRQTLPQKEMKTLAQKRANVADAFSMQGKVKGKGVLLVDDLFDSGATLDEITRLLLKEGVTRVNVLTLTRTIHSDA